METVARVFVNVQVKSAPATTFVAGMVRTLPESEPKVPVLPVVAEFASVQLAAVAAKPDAGVSVIVMALPIVATGMGVGVGGKAVPAVVVVMLAGVELRFVDVKLNVPVPPSDILRSFKLAELAAVAKIRSSMYTAWKSGLVGLPCLGPAICLTVTLEMGPAQVTVMLPVSLVIVVSWLAEARPVAEL